MPNVQRALRGSENVNGSEYFSARSAPGRTLLTQGPLFGNG